MPLMYVHTFFSLIVSCSFCFGHSIHFTYSISFPLAPFALQAPDMSSVEGVTQLLSDRRRSLDTSSKHTKRSSSQTQRSTGFGVVPPTAPTRLKVYKSNSRSKWVNREIAALEFLLGIPLEAEQAIVRKGWMQQQGIVEDDDKQTEDDEVKVDLLEPPVPHLFSAARSSQLSSHSHQGRWWEKWIANHPRGPHGGEFISRRSRVEDEELEQPDEIRASGGAFVHSDYLGTLDNSHDVQPVVVHAVHAPGRRLQGDEATKIQIPIPDETATVITRQRNIARISYMREWEIRVAHGIGDVSNKSLIKAPVPSDVQVRPPLLDGRLFFSAGESYPIGVFSILRYEPKKEEAARRRQKLEARGGGGTQFFMMPVRDWRGISYRALLPPRSSDLQMKRYNTLRIFDRFASSTPDKVDLRPKMNSTDKPGRSGGEVDSDDNDEQDDLSIDSGEEDDAYVVGLLDDPEMVQGRHRNVMFGDRVTGPIVSSTIQFVKPALLKADLNKQFRERFDGWEPPKSQRKYIGARVVDGVYTLMDPGQGVDDTSGSLLDSDQNTVSTATTNTSLGSSMTPRKRQNSVSTLSTAGGGGGGVTGGEAKETIRMPPSLTLSKIRSIKQQALLVAVQAKLEISTVALSIVYFERLCLDCRVDKTNRRLSFAACLLLALKMNEAHVELVTTTRSKEGDSKASTTNRMQSFIRPAKKSGKVLASLLEFFTQEWNLSLKHLYAAEWGVFAALQFRLHAKPSQVAFHFRRLLKAMDWNPRAYLGPRMHGYWLDALADEEYQRMKREERRKELQDRKERKKIAHLQRELQQAASRGESGNVSRLDVRDHVQDAEDKEESVTAQIIDDDARQNDFDKIDPLSPVTSPRKAKHSTRGGFGRILTHFAGGKRVLSSDKLAVTERPSEDDHGTAPRLTFSPSMPSFPTESGFLGDFSHIKMTFLGEESEDIYALSPDKPKKDREASNDNDDNDDNDTGWMFP